MAVLGIGKGREDGEGNLFRVITHEASKPVFKDDGGPSAIDKRFLDESIEKRCGFSVDVQRITWSSIFKVSYGVCNFYNNGNIFVAGDAAHVHSPIGGQGMNYSLQDSVNLMWKLAWTKRIMEDSSSSTKLESTIRQEEIKHILDSYCAERRGAAMSMIKSNAMATKALTSKNPVLRFVRETAFQRFFGGNRFRHNASNSLSMIGLSYKPQTSPILIPEHKTGCSCLPNRVSKNKMLLASGKRLPNFTSFDGKHVYDTIGRTRHTWLILRSKQISMDKSVCVEGPGGLPLLNFIVANSHHLQLPKCLLIRPDLVISSAGDELAVIWSQVVSLLGKASEFM